MPRTRSKYRNLPNPSSIEPLCDTAINTRVRRWYDEYRERIFDWNYRQFVTVRAAFRVINHTHTHTHSRTENVLVSFERIKYNEFLNTVLRVKHWQLIRIIV